MWVIFFLFSFFTSWLLLLREMCSGVMRHVPEVEKLLISIILPARWGGGTMRGLVRLSSVRRHVAVLAWRESVCF